MKIQTYRETVIIIFSLFQQIKGVNFTRRSVHLGDTFVFHLPIGESNRSDISSVEWKLLDRNRLLAHISLYNASKTAIIHQQSRLQFMQNGSIVVGDVKQEDEGNYTCKITFKDKTIKKHTVLLSLYSGITEPLLNYTFTFTTSATQTRNSQQMAIGISLFGGFLLVVAIIIILKWKEKCCTKDEPIYLNTRHKHKENTRLSKL